MAACLSVAGTITYGPILRRKEIMRIGDENLFEIHCREFIHSTTIIITIPSTDPFFSFH